MIFFKKIKEIIVNDYFKVIELLLIVISIILALSSFLLSKKANNISLQANENSLKAYSFEEIKFLEQKINYSNSYVNKIYDILNQEGTKLNTIREKLQNGEKIKDINNLKEYVDYFVDIGIKYCRFSILKDDINLYFSSMLNDVCLNDQVLECCNRKRYLAKVCSIVEHNNVEKDFYKKNGLGKYYKNNLLCNSLDDLIESRYGSYKKLNIPIIKTNIGNGE